MRISNLPIFDKNNRDKDRRHCSIQASLFLLPACIIVDLMKNVYRFYEEKIQVLTQELNRLKKKIHFIGTVRLFMVIAGCICLWLFRHTGAAALTGIGSIFLLLFVGLMVIHTKLFHAKAYTSALLQLNRNELNGLNYDYSAFDGAKEYADASHPFGVDLDLFGDRSLFQAINRTGIFPGKKQLAAWFMHPLTDKTHILTRQEAVKELAQLPDLRQQFQVFSQLYRNGQNDEDILYRLMNASSILPNKKYWKVLIWLVPATWLIVFVLTGLQIISPTFIGWLVILFFGLAMSQTKKIKLFHNSVSKMEKILSTYARLIKQLENYPFEAAELKEISGALTYGNEKTSEAIKKLSLYLGNLDQRYNCLAAFILNTLFLWDIRQTLHIEEWKNLYASRLNKWFDALGKFDALSSVATFAFNHPDYIFPEITDRYFRLTGKQVGHPLMPRESCVKNNISIPDAPGFLIITGANMAGKSTYLRTIGVNYLLACTGAPVDAEEFILYPARLVTSLRTTDSLNDNESYFFAELKRLKMIIERLNRGEKLFIILDEILKGTNSVDKQKGSIALMKQLISLRSCGIIATHDLILGELAKAFPEQIKNYRFEADIANDELTFSYKLKEGIAQNMNACFLMKKMGITV